MSIKTVKPEDATNAIVRPYESGTYIFPCGTKYHYDKTKMANVIIEADGSKIILPYYSKGTPEQEEIMEIIFWWQDIRGDDRPATAEEIAEHDEIFADIA